MRVSEKLDEKRGRLDKNRGGWDESVRKRR